MDPRAYELKLFPCSVKFRILISDWCYQLIKAHSLVSDSSVS